ncbi:MAG: hypothetical protein HYS53_01810 [Candidatus Aenigmarchaeota archaeon]|nr:hypothetical protein [Candidatus Aenigmarchaeota archaeon]
MVEFETVNSKETNFGRNNFLEIARKRAKTEEGENEFLSISRGFFSKTGEKIYKRSVAIPLDGEVMDFLLNSITEMRTG